jgi:Zn-finger nucleic acid-binding protein
MQTEFEIGCDCPVCSKSMREVPLTSSGDVKVDTCRTCQFVWLDGGEIEKFVLLPPVSTTPYLLPEQAQDILGPAMVKQLQWKGALENLENSRRARGYGDNIFDVAFWMDLFC